MNSRQKRNSVHSAGTGRMHNGKTKLNSLQIASIVLGSIVLICAASFGGYVIHENVMHQRALENYPVAYTDFITQYATEYEQDPYLVQSIMRCESSNDPDAVSNVGAIGLMQIMPDTGTWIAHKLDLDDVYTEEMLYDPQTNIEFGCWYLHFLSGRFHDNRKQMIAAYNAGHGTVEKWLEDPKYSQDGELVTIPYEQTARYYDNVTTAYENYTTLYPDLFLPNDPATSIVEG